MGAETEQEAEGRSHSAAWTWLFWLGAGMLLYVLSTGPVVLLGEKGGISPRMGTVVEVVYAPLWWTCNNTLFAKATHLDKALGLYYHFWAPKRFDKNGNLVIHVFKAE